MLIHDEDFLAIMQPVLEAFTEANQLAIVNQATMAELWAKIEGAIATEVGAGRWRITDLSPVRDETGWIPLRDLDVTITDQRFPGTRRGSSNLMVGFRRKVRGRPQ
jgi:hypothetical protein